MADIGREHETPPGQERARAARRAALRDRFRATFERLGGDGARLFDDEEIETRREEVISILIDYGGYVNEFLQISANQQAPCDIWTLDEEDAKPLAALWLRRAQRDPRAAAALRAALDGNDYLRAAAVLGPRLWYTSKWYPAHGGFKLSSWQANNARRRARMRVVNDAGGERGPTP